MRRLAPFGLCGLLAFAAIAPRAASAQSQPSPPLADQVEQRLQQMRKAQQPGNDPQPRKDPQPADPLMLTSSELDALRNRLAACWDPPKALRAAPSVIVSVEVKFAKDGSLAEPPKVLNSNPDPRFAAAAKSAVAALTKCAPFSFLPAAKYATWQEIVIDFDPHEMFGDKPQ